MNGVCPLSLELTGELQEGILHYVVVRAWLQEPVRAELYCSLHYASDRQQMCTFSWRLEPGSYLISRFFQYLRPFQLTASEPYAHHTTT